MALEAITIVEEAEAAAAARKTEAALEARKLADAARIEGEQVLKDARERAGQKLRELDAEAEDRIRVEAEAIRSDTEKEMSVLRARAEDRLDKAAERIVERIVSG